MSTEFSSTTREEHQEIQTRPSNFNCRLMTDQGRSSAPSSSSCSGTTHDGSNSAIDPLFAAPATRHSLSAPNQLPCCIFTPDQESVRNKGLAGPWGRGSYYAHDPSGRCHSEPNRGDLASSDSVTTDAGEFALVGKPVDVPDVQESCYQPSPRNSNAQDSDEWSAFGPQPSLRKPRETGKNRAPVCYLGPWLFPEIDDSVESDGCRNALFDLYPPGHIGLDGPASLLWQKYTDLKTVTNGEHTQFPQYPKDAVKVPELLNLSTAEPAG